MKELPRIAFLSLMEGFPWGGSEDLWSGAALDLRARGFDVRVCVKGWPKAVSEVEAMARAGCDVTHRREILENARYVGRVARRIYRIFDPTMGQFRWLETVRDRLLVISQGGNTGCSAWANECIARGIRYAIVSQAATENWWPQDNDAQALRTAYENAAATYFVSRANAELTSRQLALPLPEARIVRNPFRVAYDAAPPWPGDAGGLHLACVGRLEAAGKGQDLILEVMRKDKWRQRHVTVTLFGAGPNEMSFRRVVELYKLANVTFGGFVADVAAIWARHHALLLPSRFEGLPLALVEAMLCGRPGIVTDVAGNTEILTDGLTGFVAAAPTVELLDQAMERAWEKRDRWREMGEAAAVRIRELVPERPAAVFADELMSLL